MHQTVHQVVAEYGRIAMLINGVDGSTIIANAGASVEELTLDDWQRLITFHLNGTFLCYQTVVLIMKRQRSGKIVNISSMAGRGLSESSSSA